MPASAPLEIERKLVIEEPDVAVLDAEATSVSDIAQTYLLGEDGETARVRRRLVRDADGERLQLTHTRKRPRSAGIVEEREREVDEQEYARLVARADPARVTVVKTRWVVPYAGRILEIDRFSSPRALWLLEVELPDAADLTVELELPGWLTVVSEVTGDPAYSNAALALVRD
jgi:CYTH domain-containing protein